MTNSPAPQRVGKESKLSVTRLRLTNFRSYTATEIAVSGAPVVLSGPNGAGKTNLLDAISLLSPGRGLRGARLGDHTRRGPSAMSEALWAVAATVSRAGESYEIGTGVTSAHGNERRQVRLNGVAAQSSADLGDVVQMLWLTPAMDRLFIESASGRRKFLDRLTLGFDAGHARAEAALRDRDARARAPAQIRPTRSRMARRAGGGNGRSRSRDGQSPRGSRHTP